MTTLEMAKVIPATMRAVDYAEPWPARHKFRCQQLASY